MDDALASNYFKPDRYGVPGSMLGYSEALYGQIGRVTALGALAEDKLTTLAAILTERSNSEVALPYGQLSKLCRAQVALLEPQLSEQGGRALDQLDAAMEGRHTVVHGLWATQDLNHRGAGSRKQADQYAESGGRIIHKVAPRWIENLIRDLVTAIEEVDRLRHAVPITQMRRT